MNALLIEANLINGRWQGATSGEVISVTNPATQEVIGRVPDCDAADLALAVDAANEAFFDWKNRTARERGAILHYWSDLIVNSADQLAAILTAEQGKTLAEAKREILYGAEYITWYAEEGRRLYGVTIPTPKSSVRMVVSIEPVGVCAGITPWNFPMAMLARTVAPALAAGCTFIAKPDHLTPFSALALAKLGEEAGIPQGVFNVLTGKAKVIGGAMMAHPGIAKVSFTGSTRVGKILIEQSAATLKKLTLELGGNAPCIIFDDGDLEKAARDSLSGKLRNSGQTCVCVNRFLVEKSIRNQFVELLKIKMSELKVGNGSDPSVDLGPLISCSHRDKILEKVGKAIAGGAKIELGSIPKEGNAFLAPIILTQVQPAMEIVRDEIFGPVTAIIDFEGEQQAITIANDTEYGLAAYIYSRDIGRIERVKGALNVGIVGINTMTVSYVEAPFGGVKDSGYGRVGGFWGIEEYTRTKSAIIDIE